MSTYFDRLLVAFQHVSMVPRDVRGFTTWRLNQHLNRVVSDETNVLLARGSVVGGTREYLEVAAAALSVILRTTVSEGDLGDGDVTLTYVTCIAVARCATRRRLQTDCRDDDLCDSILEHLAPHLVHRFDQADDADECQLLKRLTTAVEPQHYDLRGLTCTYVHTTPQRDTLPPKPHQCRDTQAWLVTAYQVPAQRAPRGVLPWTGAVSAGGDATVPRPRPGQLRLHRRRGRARPHILHRDVQC